MPPRADVIPVGGLRLQSRGGVLMVHALYVMSVDCVGFDTEMWYATSY